MAKQSRKNYLTERRGEARVIVMAAQNLGSRFSSAGRTSGRTGQPLSHLGEDEADELFEIAAEATMAVAKLLDEIDTCLGRKG